MAGETRPVRSARSVGSRIRAASGWHLVSFTAPVEQLPNIVERTLRERLALLVSEAAAAG